jgi:hypothetical protein
LGAEKSIFAKNLCLTLTAASGAKITGLNSGNYRKVIDPSGDSAQVYFPNLMIGEQRDVLVVMGLPAVSEPDDAHRILASNLEYHRIEGGNQVNLAGQDCMISRVAIVDSSLERNNDVDVQINRALLDRATAASLALADQGNYEHARGHLNTTLEMVKTSASCRRNDKKSAAFVSELEATISNLEDEDTYRYGGGRSMMSEMASNINQQRCTYAKAGRSEVYQNKSSLGSQAKTKAKKASFFGSGSTY